MAGRREGVLLRMRGGVAGKGVGRAFSLLASSDPETLFVLLRDRSARLFDGLSEGESGSIDEEADAVLLRDLFLERKGIGGEEGGTAECCRSCPRVARAGEEVNGGVAIFFLNRNKRLC